jgi:hypothetical protein
VVLVPESGSGDPQRNLAFQTESDGSFDFADVPAGDYVLFASENLELEYANPEVLRPYLKDGKRVRIEPHDARALTIPLQ